MFCEFYKDSGQHLTRRKFYLKRENYLFHDSLGSAYLVDGQSEIKIVYERRSHRECIGKNRTKN